MEIKDIQTLVELVAKSGIHELELERAGMKVRIVGLAAPAAPAAAPTTQVVMAAPSMPAMPAMGFPTAAVAPVAAAPQAGEGADAVQSALVEEKLHKVVSPIVGTFYQAASPTAEPFVKLGDRVRKGQVICIVEAMKVMNEIEADADGEVVKIFVSDGTPVEYNQPLIALKA